MGFFPKNFAIVAVAGVLSAFCFSSVEARPVKADLESVNVRKGRNIELPTKEASCHKNKRHHRHCDRVHVISRVPYTITRSGKYCVSRDLTYTDSGAAITVEADNVTINFANHSLFLTNPAAQGILAVDVEELTILNDKISLNSISTDTNSNAIHLIGVSKARIDNIFTENTLRGIRIEGSNDITITNSHHKNHVGADAGTGIDIRAASTGVSIDNAFFEGTSGANNFQDGAITVTGGSSNVIITNTKHFNVDQALFVAGASTGVLVENLEATFSPDAFFGGINLGGANDEDPSRDITLRNVTLTNLDAITGWDGINVGLANGLLFDNIIIDVNTATASDFTPAALHFGCNEINGCEEAIKTSTNGIFSNIVITNTNDYGLLIESGNNLVFENIEVSGSSIDNILVASGFDNVIKDSLVADSNGGNGIVVDADATSTTLFNNTVTRNQTGILINSGADSTVVDSNRVYNNVFGITDNDASTLTYYNRVCGNGTNCTGVFPANTLGNPSEVGENICNCAPPT